MVLIAQDTKERDAPVTLHGVMRSALGQQLEACYRPEREIPHRLLTILMQMNEEERRSKSAV